MKADLVITDLKGALAEAVLQETRLSLIAALSSPACQAAGGFALQDLAEQMSCTVQNMHHHLKVLKRAGLVRVVRSEATQRIPRQFWVSDVRAIRVRPAPGVDVIVDVSPGPRVARQITRIAASWSDRHGRAEVAPVLVAMGAILSSMEDVVARDLLKTLASAVDDGLHA